MSITYHLWSSSKLKRWRSPSLMSSSKLKRWSTWTVSSWFLNSLSWWSSQFLETPMIVVRMWGSKTILSAFDFHSLIKLPNWLWIHSLICKVKVIVTRSPLLICCHNCMTQYITQCQCSMAVLGAASYLWINFLLRTYSVWAVITKWSSGCSN